MNRTINIIAEYLKKEDIGFSTGPDDDSIWVPSSIEEAELNVLVIADQSVLSIGAHFSAMVPVKRRKAIAELFMRTNWNLRYGAFMVNLETGQPIFRIAAPVDEEKISPEDLQTLFSDLVERTLFFVNDLYDIVMKVAFGNITAKLGFGLLEARIAARNSQQTKPTELLDQEALINN